MYFKLAVNNVKKSFRDYAIYFLTLTFSVCIFYVFNALESQKAMMDVSYTTNLMMQNLVMLISYLSIFVAIVLGFLILYANKFLIRRRKKELGLYMILGMEKGKISFILVLETLMIGLCSLVVGLVLGIFLSQAVSVFTAKLFGAQMNQFRFVFSEDGLIKSIACFVIIYIVIMIFNVITLSKCKLIDLLYANKKNEIPKIKNLKISVILFLVAVLCIGTSYVFIIKNNLDKFDIYFNSAFILCFIGTFLFFMSLSGFLLKIMQSCKKLYYSEMNMFIFRQINSKINTAYISMTFISLMLAVTIVTLSSGMGMNQAITAELKDLTPYDGTFLWEKSERWPEVRNIDIQEQLKKLDLPLEAYIGDVMSYKTYETSIPFKTFYKGQDIETLSIYLQYASEKKVEAMALSDYNEILKHRGIEPITLDPDKYVINTIDDLLIDVIKDYGKSYGKLEYEGKEFEFDKLLSHTAYDQSQAEREIYMILPDEVVNKEEIRKSVMNFNYINVEMEDAFVETLVNEMDKMKAEGVVEEVQISAMTREMIYDMSVGMSAIMTYLTVYLSIIFLIASAAILALQQLTEAEDNKTRYELLRKLGVDEKVIHRTLFTQIAIYFMVPLSLALIHGLIGIYVANKVIMVAGEINILSSILFTALVFVGIYGTYFIGTYLSSKNVIK